MDEVISSADANREFSRLLREVRQGKSYVVTSHGRPVARIVPVTEDADARQRAWSRLLERLESQPALKAGKWTRDELYERDK
jgi:prevent-host-death family protein